ncbi:MAG: cation:proton antiporter [Lentisphaeraceae bacterium]|nr:cation:proton antiporter [Lentisphaeraceae bacterium]
MLLKIITIFIIAVIFGKLAEKLKLPKLLGYMLAGIVFSPHTQELLRLPLELSFTKTELVKSTPVRLLALFIILFRAGLGLDKAGLIQNGKAAARLAILPCLCEATVIALFSHYFLGFLWPESFLLAFVISAVSPAVIVPMMLELKEKRIGTDKKIPTLILASASIDDIVAITGFGACLSILSVNMQESWLVGLIFLPFSILTGFVSGVLIVRPLKSTLAATTTPAFLKVILLLAIAHLFKEIEETNIIPFSHLVAIMSFGFAIRETLLTKAEPISKSFYQIWQIAEVVLFVIIGAMVDLNLAMDMGLTGCFILFIGLCARSVASYLSLSGTNLNSSEKLFCTLAYWPKATVQATIGGLALSLFYEGSIKLYNGAEMGEFILTMAASSILITAPIGAIAIRLSSERLLSKEP